MIRLRPKSKSKDPFVRYSVNAFYHFTDLRNLAMIREHGGLYSLHQLQEREIEIPIPGGNELSHELDAEKGLDHYIHLCFKKDHPMEFVARQEGRLGKLIYLEVHPKVRKFDGVRFAPDVSNKTGVCTHPFEEALDLIDFEVLYTITDWNDPPIQERLKQAEKSELLVPDHIPLKYIRNCPNG